MKKVETTIVDTKTNELLVLANLTPAATKRFIKLYERLGITTRASEKVSA